MSAGITPFLFEGFAVRTVQTSGQLWFVAADVCSILDLGNISMACGRLDDDEKGISSVDTLFGGSQEMLTVNESGLYSLILTSRKPKAKSFKRWVTGEVLPTIRKTGGYGAQSAPAFTLPDFTNPAAAARAWADAIEATQAATIERDHAIATKAHIGSKREATAMATASAAKKESSALKEQLGFGANFATVTAVQNATGNKFDWLPLRRWCKTHATPANDVQDKRYGTVKAWPAGAWANVFGVDLMDLFGEVAA